MPLQPVGRPLGERPARLAFDGARPEKLGFSALQDVQDLRNGVLGKARRNTKKVREPASPSALGYLPDGDPRAEQAWRLLEAIVAELARDVRADGGRLVVLAIPSAREIYPDPEALRDWAGPIADVVDLDVQERRVTRLCERLGLPFVSLKPRFLAEANGSEPLYLARLGHLSARGHRVAAAVLADRLRDVP